MCECARILKLCHSKTMGARISRVSSKKYMRLPSSEYEAEVHFSASLARVSSADSEEGMIETLTNPEIVRANLKTLGRVAGADRPITPPDTVRRTGSKSGGSQWQLRHHRGPDSSGQSENEKSMILSESKVSSVLR